MTTIIDAETGEVLVRGNGDALVDTPGPIVLHKTGLEVVGELAFDEWRQFGANLTAVQGSIHWWIGDWLNFGERKYGETYAQAVDETGFDNQTLRIDAWVASRIELFRRRNNLSFAHHQEVASLPQEQQERWLARAETESMSRAELRREIQAAKALEARHAGSPTTPTIELADALDWLLRQPPADLVLTDPPYSTDVNDIRAFAADWLPLALRVLKPTGRAFICIGAYPEEIAAYAAVAMPTQILVWTYRNTLGPQPSHDYKLNWQAILYYRGERAGPLNCPLMVEQFTVQDINAPDGRVGDRYHKWQKPLELGQRFVNHATSPGDIVLDPFCGTGTFLLAASALGRTARGCDIDQDMLDIAISRGCSYAR